VTEEGKRCNSAKQVGEVGERAQCALPRRCGSVRSNRRRRRRTKDGDEDEFD
jgi:hypothetical protein